MTVYLRLMFTLSLGALAGVITLYGTMLRFGTSASISMITPLEVVLAIAALAALVTSALLSARALQKSAFDVAPLLHNPFPSADSVIDSIFDADDIDERQILRKLYFALDKTVEHQPPLRLSTRLITLFLIGGLFLTGASFYCEERVRSLWLFIIIDQEYSRSPVQGPRRSECDDRQAGRATGPGHAPAGAAMCCDACPALLRSG